MRELRDLLDRFNAVSAKFAEPDADFDALLAEQATVQDADRPRRRVGARPASRPRDGRAAAAGGRPRRRRRSRAASAGASRCAGCCCRRPTCCCSTSRRTISTPSRSRGSSASSPTTRARSSPSRTTATSSTTWPAGSSSSTAARGIPFEGNYSSWLEQKQERLAVEEKQESARRRTLARELEWVRMSPRARQAKGKARLARLRAAVRRGAERQARQGRDPHPAGSAPRRRRHRGRGPAEGLRRPAAHRGPHVLAPAGRDRRRDRSERRRQDDAVPHDRRPGAARRGDAPSRRDGAARLRRPGARRPRARRAPSGRRSAAAPTRSSSASAR